MGEMASSWGYAEYQDMDQHQLGQKLLYTTLELEKLKSETMEEMQKNKDYIDQLILVLKCALQERDEAKKQLEKLIISTTNSDTFSHFQAVKANSSITESNSNHGSPPVESLFNDPSIHQESSIFDQRMDEGSLIIESLVKGKVLPEKGMLVKAVIEAGPLLQTLLIAGPLPRWRNPPQMQAFQIPPVSIRGSSSDGGGYTNFGCVGDNDYFGSGKRQRFC